MSRLIVLVVAVLALCYSSRSLAQEISHDSSQYRLPADSSRIFDSAYRARKAQLDMWIKAQRSAAHPQEDFISLYVGYGGYLQILPRDINQFFSERSFRADPTSDRNNYGTIDRAIIIGGQAQLSRSWGIYAEYDYSVKYANTQIDIDTLGLLNAFEELDLIEHAFVVGGMYMIYSGEFYRLRLNGGIGGVIALTTETESKSNASRSASATGYQVNFDILNDFRVSQNVSFTIDLLTRSITTGELKTSDGQTLDAPFGARKTPLSLKPNASNVVYGLAAGLVFYF